MEKNINTGRPKTAPKGKKVAPQRSVQRVTNGLSHTSKKVKQVYTECFVLI